MKHQHLALRRTVAIVALLNLGYCLVEGAVAWGIGSVSLFADSMDFLEDAAVNALIFVALGWPLARRCLIGRALALVILLPAIAAMSQAVARLTRPDAPEPLSLVVTAGGAVVINLVCSRMLLRHREHGGSLSHAAWLAARNDVIINIAIIAAGILTLTVVRNGWPDLIVGLGILILNSRAALEVWELASQDDLAAKAITDQNQPPA